MKTSVVPASPHKHVESEQFGQGALLPKFFQLVENDLFSNFEVVRELVEDH